MTRRRLIMFGAALGLSLLLWACIVGIALFFVISEMVLEELR